MSVKKPRPASAVVLSERDQTVAEAVLDLKSIKDAAELAGCSPSTAGNVVKRSYDVQAYIEDHRKEISNATQLKRADVVAGFMEAIDMARLGADPSAMIKGWVEVGKMLGLYAPEVKRVELTSGQRNIRSKFEIMSDEELLAIAEGRETVIDGECITVQ